MVVIVLLLLFKLLFVSVFVVHLLEMVKRLEDASMAFWHEADGSKQLQHCKPPPTHQLHVRNV